MSNNWTPIYKLQPVITTRVAQLQATGANVLISDESYSILEITTLISTGLQHPPTSNAQSLCTQRAHNLVDDSILQRFLGVKVLVAVEVKLDLHNNTAGSHISPYHAHRTSERG